MMSFRPTRKFSRFAVATVFGAAVVIGCAGSYAHAADDDDDEMIDTKVFRGSAEGPRPAPGWRGDRLSRALAAGAAARQGAQSAAVAGRRRQGQAGRPTGRTIPTSSAPGSARKPNASASRSKPGVDDRPLMARQDDRMPPPAPTGNKAGEAPGISAEDAAAPSTPAELGTKGFMNMFKTGLWAPKEEYVALHRRAGAHQPDRAAARLSDAVADPALRRRQGQVDGADDRQERARQIVTTPDRALFDGLRHVLASLDDAADPPANIRETAFAKPDR